MGKPRKTKKKFQYGRNRRKEWKKSKQEKNIDCAQLKAAWDDNKSVTRNLTDMGLSANPNVTLSIPTPKDYLGVDSVTMETLRQLRQKIPKKKALKGKVVEDLEAEANIPQAKTLKLAEPEVEYCIYMSEKYGEDYKAMARDHRNYYQDTPKQIRNKIKTFTKIPLQYNQYLASKTQAMETT